MIHNKFALAAILLAAACGSKDAKPTEATTRPVRYAIVAPASADLAREFTAVLQSEDATQLSFRVGGPLTELKIKTGDSVAQGQRLASLDTSDLKVAVAQAKANWSGANNQRNVAKSAFERIEKLYVAGSATRADYDAAKGQLQSAGSQAQAASQQVKQAANQLTYAIMKAPFSGVINSVSVEKGESVRVGDVVAVLSRGVELEVRVLVPEGVIGKIKVGAKSIVSVSTADAATLTATVTEVSFAAENATYPVILKLEETPEGLRPGMAATARFDFGQEAESLVVPSTSVGNEEKGTFVFVVQAKGDGFVAKKREIQVGELFDQSFAIESGLEAGEKVATAGVSLLVDGMAVELLDAPSSLGTTPIVAPEAKIVSPATEDQPTP
tara:strand:- start:81998 stop:83149 length:1152 start_codon:yes stop_codon:yes gene_type:complete